MEKSMAWWSSDGRQCMTEVSSERENKKAVVCVR